MKQTRYSNREIWHVAYPILVSLVMEQIIGMTDTAFLGRVGEVELGASAIAGIFYVVVFMIAFGFSIGAQIMMARRNGEEKYVKIGGLFYQGLYFQMGLATCMFLLCLFFAPYLLRIIVSSDNVYRASLDYLNWRIPGFFFSFATVMFRSFYVATTQTKTLTLNSLVMVISNVVFNYLLIFGKFGLPAMGISGAALGSTLAGMVSLLFFLLYTYKRIDIAKYGLNTIPPLKTGSLKRMLKISFWTMIQNFVSLSTWFLLFLYIEHLGERSLAITNIIRNVSGIPFMIINAFAATCGSLVSNQIGAGFGDSVRNTIHQHIRLAYAIVLPLVALFALFPNVVLGIYTDISDLRQAAIPSLYVLCSTYLLVAPANIYFQAVSGTGNTRTAFVLELGTLVAYTTYITYIVYIKRCDVAVAWTSEYVYNGLLLIACYLYIKRGSWKLNRSM
ncbi:MAG: MATE family efflux transporter [Mediterranea massiliensis]|nr:MATE family efflux transporter [Mediterranea massiliensis]